MAKFSKYRDVLNYMFEQLPMYQRVGAPAFKKDLTNTIRLLKICGNPHLDLKTIHIAGTNGKGSTSHLIAAGLQAQGFTVGLYTSPHYKDFRERIKINGSFINSYYIKYFINTYYLELENIKPSFFEMTVVLSFLWFRHQQVDFAVIETGLGGRLDSTNVIIPLLSVITNISFDHQNMLGDTLEKIAFEKAGIIKKEIPVLIGEKQTEVQSVFEKMAREKNAHLYYAESMIQIIEKVDTSVPKYTVFLKGKLWMNDLTLDVKGPFQIKNLTTALAAMYLLKKNIEIQEKKILDFYPEFAKRTHFIGRWQILSEKPFILADSAHNEAGIKYVLDYLENKKTEQLHILLGFVNDKDIGTILFLFPKNAVYYFAKANIPRGLPAGELAALAKKYGLVGKPYSSVKSAFTAAKKKLAYDDVLFVGGSIFVVAEII